MSGNYSDGLVSEFVSGLDMNETYYYRWMAGNSVNSESWSFASQDGMLAFWDLNENANAFSMDKISGRKATFVGISDSDRLFGRKGNGIRFGGAGEHMVVKGFRGVIGDKARTVSVWAKTNDTAGSLLAWGSNGGGRFWDFDIINGNLGLRVNNGRLETVQSVNNNAWRHLAVVFPSAAEVLDDVVLYVDGIPQARTLSANPVIDTGDENDLLIGTNLTGNNFAGVLDEIRIYERGLSSNEVMSIYLDGTMVFTTSSTAQPPVVELSNVIAEANASVRVVGELVSKDVSDPIIRIYYGLDDGGFDPVDWNNTFVEVNGGNTVTIGEFNATISGLIPGQRYFFRALAQSVDGSDWSSGDPEVSVGLMGYWRMDENNGSIVSDSLAPFRNARLQGNDLNQSRQDVIVQKVYILMAFPLVHLDANTDYLEESFDGRSVSIA